jgi:REP element-mobilizing transposase RayT
VVKKIALGVANMKTPKFVTLTLAGVPGEFRSKLLLIWGLRKYFFKVLRRRGYRIDGWVAIVEAPNHIHLIVDMEYIPQHEMAEVWRTVTGDSFIVDVRAVLDSAGRDRAVNYLAKYLGKSQCWDQVNLSLLKGFHLFNNNGLHLESWPKECPCDCGIGPLRFVCEDEYVHWLYFEVKPPDL